MQANVAVNQNRALRRLCAFGVEDDTDYASVVSAYRWFVRHCKSRAVTVKDAYSYLTHPKRRLGNYARARLSLADFRSEFWETSTVKLKRQWCDVRRDVGQVFADAAGREMFVRRGVTFYSGEVGFNELCSALDRVGYYRVNRGDLARMVLDPLKAAGYLVQTDAGRGRGSRLTLTVPPEVAVAYLDERARKYGAQRAAEGARLQEQADARRVRREGAEQRALWGPKRETRHEAMWRSFGEQREGDCPGILAREHAEAVAEMVAADMAEPWAASDARDLVPATAAQLQAMAAARRT